MNTSELAICLAKAETEEDVKSLLKKFGIWDDLNFWHPFGGNGNNYSIIGNQQATPDAAFVEKIINSIDACLIKECLKSKTDPEGPSAPQTMQDALDKYFGVPGGQMTKLDLRGRSDLAKNIIVAATGKQRGEMNLCIADCGEGQTPQRMTDTILSISKSNKLKIPFVQGKFNMGGTGVLPYCGGDHLQLVISRRCPALLKEGQDTAWSVTVVRKEPARAGSRSSMYTYFADRDGKLFSFIADSLPVIPKSYVAKQSETQYEPMEYGTFIKLYNYQLTGYKTSIVLDYNYRAALLIPNLALPVRLRECRAFGAHTNEAILAGLVTRLHDDRSNNIEDGFPGSCTFTVDGQTISCAIYLFKKGKQVNFRRKEGVLFMVNGQTQGMLNDSFFTRANLPYIKDSILVLVDCTRMDISHQEEFFMTSRDRIRQSDFSREVERSLEQELKEHPGLKQAEHDRRANALKDKISDNKPLKDVLERVLKKSSVLSKLFFAGREISAPFNSTIPAGDKQLFEGKDHPTFFSLKGVFKDGRLVKQVPVNSDFRVQFTTDVTNDYFDRPIDAGRLVLNLDGKERNDLAKHLSLFNGVATLSVRLPKDAKEGSVYTFSTEICDECIVDQFPSEFSVIVTKAADPRPGGTGSRHKPIDSTKGGQQKQPSGFSMPNIKDVYKDGWEELDMDPSSALVYRSSSEGDDYFLNMDNNYLLAELKGIRDKGQVDLTKAKFKYSMALIGMSIVSFYKRENKETNGEIPDIAAQVKQISSMVSPVLIPMLDSMSQLDEENIENERET